MDKFKSFLIYIFFGGLIGFGASVAYNKSEVEKGIGTGSFVEFIPKENQIVLYTASWCTACKMAKEYLTENEIVFAEKDIEIHHDYLYEFESLGTTDIPVMMSATKKVNRFSTSIYEQFLESL